MSSFRNGVGSEKCTEAQQVGCGEVGLFDLLEGEGPGSGYRLRMIGDQAPASLQQVVFCGSDALL